MYSLRHDRRIGQAARGNPAPLFLFDQQRGGACWMTEEYLPAAGSAEALLRQAEEQFSHIALELGEAARRAVEGEAGAAKTAAQAARELRDAFRIMVSERERVDKLRTQIAGVAGGRDLDFDAARDEIGRRLARLRDAGSGG